MQRSSQIQGGVVERQAVHWTGPVTKPCGNQSQVPRAPNCVGGGHRSYVSSSESTSTRLSIVTILVEKQTRRHKWSL